MVEAQNVVLHHCFVHPEGKIVLKLMQEKIYS